jgi:hypothetical protein
MSFDENNHIHMETIPVKPSEIALGSFILYPTDLDVPSITRVMNVEFVKGAWRITTQNGAFVVPDGEHVRVVS